MRVKKEFLFAKDRALEKLDNAQLKNEVDKGIIQLLNLINNSKEYYTSSSCAGRILLLQIPKIGDKKQAEFLGRWHRTIKKEDISKAIEKSDKGILWLLAQSPILHIGAKTNTAADRIVKIANASGFKNSNIKSVGKKPLVEIGSTERLDAPIGEDGVLFCGEEHIELLVRISNEVMKKSMLKLGRFEQEIKKYLSTSKTTTS